MFLYGVHLWIHNILGVVQAMTNLKKLKLMIAAAIAVASLPALASQNSIVLPTVSPYPGLTMLNNVNSAFDTLQSNFSGATAPSSPKVYQLWADTANHLLKTWDGTSWLPIAKFENNQWVSISNGVVGTIPASTGTVNDYIVTYSPAPSALVVGQHYPFIANFTNTGVATVNVNSLGAHYLTKRGTTPIGANDITSGSVVDTVWDGTYFQMTSLLGSLGAGTVTTVDTANGITGGPISVSGTVGLSAISNATALANTSGSTAAPTATTITSILNGLFGTTQGTIFYRGASSWSALTPGASGKPLLTGGTGANPSYGNAPVTALNGGTNASSSTYWRGDGVWAAATGGTTGWTSCTRGASPCGSSATLVSGGCTTDGYPMTTYPSGKAWVCDCTNDNYCTPWVVCCQ